MRLRAKTHITLKSPERAAFVAMLRPQSGAGQWILSETYDVRPLLSPMEYVDVFGNLWCSASGPLGYAGVFVYNAQGKMIGRIRLPEVCANMCFGGPKRNQLFMTASQSVYMLQLNTQGAAPG